jgi:predicted DNA-binding protein (UPF0278 family)
MTINSKIIKNSVTPNDKYPHEHEKQIKKFLSEGVNIKEQLAFFKNIGIDIKSRTYTIYLKKYLPKEYETYIMSKNFMRYIQDISNAINEFESLEDQYNFLISNGKLKIRLSKNCVDFEFYKNSVEKYKELILREFPLYLVFQ